MLNWIKKKNSEDSYKEIESKDIKFYVNSDQKSFLKDNIFKIIGLLFFITFFSSNIIYQYMSKHKEHVQILEIKGLITDEKSRELVLKIEKIKKNESIKGLLVVIDSPGGSPTGSKEIEMALKNLKSKKEVFIYISGTAASGGYYIASMGSPIYANQNSVVGSIGVLMPHFNIKELSKKVGVEYDSISFGKYKEPINYFDKPTKENKEYLIDRMLKPMYINFVTDMANNRKVSYKQMEQFADGQIFIANDPRIKGILIDHITSYSNMLDLIHKKYDTKENKIEIRYDVEKLSMPQLFNSIFFNIVSESFSNEFKNYFENNNYQLK